MMLLDRFIASGYLGRKRPWWMPSLGLVLFLLVIGVFATSARDSPDRDDQVDTKSELRVPRGDLEGTLGAELTGTARWDAESLCPVLTLSESEDESLIVFGPEVQIGVEAVVLVSGPVAMDDEALIVVGPPVLPRGEDAESSVVKECLGDTGLSKVVYLR